MDNLPERVTRHIHVDEQSGCWVWTHRLDRYGYVQQIRTPAGRLVGHVAVWVLSGRHRPEGMDLDHLCRNRACVNPTHLEPVTHQVNCQRGDVGKHNAVKTHCRNNHPLSGDNLRVITSKTGTPERVCRTCSRAASERYEEKRKARRREKVGAQ